MWKLISHDTNSLPARSKKPVLPSSVRVQSSSPTVAASSRKPLITGSFRSIIDGLGDKVKARTAAIKSNVAVVPGTEGAISDIKEAEAFIKESGFPVIIKAAMVGSDLCTWQKTWTDLSLCFRAVVVRNLKKLRAD